MPDSIKTANKNSGKCFNKFPKVDCDLGRKYTPLTEIPTQWAFSSTCRIFFTDMTQDQGQDDRSRKTFLYYRVEEGKSNYC